MLEITVYGTPAPAGSKKAFAIRRGGVPTGQIAVSDDNKRSAPWKKEIQQAVGRAMAARPPLEGALAVEFTFYVRRPQGHYGTGKHAGRVRDSAPALPAVKPDLLKLARAVEDAMSGCVYRDDSQIVEEHLFKRYGSPERVEVRVQRAGGALLLKDAVERLRPTLDSGIESVTFSTGGRSATLYAHGAKREPAGAGTEA